MQQGLFDGHVTEIIGDRLALYRNMGGFHMLGRSVDMIRTREQLEQTRRSCLALSLDGLVSTFIWKDTIVLSCVLT